MLCHGSLDRAAHVAAHWAAAGSPVSIHVDARVAQAEYDQFADKVQSFDHIRFATRRACEWGRWSLVQATQDAAEVLLTDFPDVTHVFLASGTCLPLRPVAELEQHLADRPDTDFIESVSLQDGSWTKGGLERERFSLWFPVSWKRRRRLFDQLVVLQRKLGVKRRVPQGAIPHMGSQWWCLTRKTLETILSDPRRAAFDRYFRHVWIPDESYFQTLVRRVSTNLESRSLTLSKFDFQGKPHIFYDDHLHLLKKSDCFVARKIWPQADALYDHFLSDAAARDQTTPDPVKIDRFFAQAMQRRLHGRPGLYMASRFPRDGAAAGKTCARYAVFEGFGDLFEDFPNWLNQTLGLTAHGHLFAPDGAEFADGQHIYAGSLSAAPKLRDYNVQAFLTNLLWNTQGQSQSFLFGPRDTQKIEGFVASDPNASIFAISGAWAVPLFHAQKDAAVIRNEVARLQKIESAHLALLRDPQVRARVRIWSLADFVAAPNTALQHILDGFDGRSGATLAEAPRMRDLTGFSQFLQKMRDQGVPLQLVGHFPAEDAVAINAASSQKPYAVR